MQCDLLWPVGGLVLGEETGQVIPASTVRRAVRVVLEGLDAVKMASSVAPRRLGLRRLVWMMGHHAVGVMVWFAG